MVDAFCVQPGSFFIHAHNPSYIPARNGNGRYKIKPYDRGILSERCNSGPFFRFPCRFNIRSIAYYSKKRKAQTGSTFRTLYFTWQYYIFILGQLYFKMVSKFNFLKLRERGLNAGDWLKSKFICNQYR